MWVRDELKVERRLAPAVRCSGGREERVVLLEEHQLDISGACLARGGGEGKGGEGEGGEGEGGEGEGGEG